MNLDRCKKGISKKKLEYTIIDKDGNVKTTKTFPKELKKNKPRTRNVEDHFEYGGEISINDKGEWLMGLSEAKNLPDRYSRLREGNYISTFENKLGKLDDHKITRFDCDRSKLNGDYKNDFKVYKYRMYEAGLFDSPTAAGKHLSDKNITLDHVNDGFDLVDRDLHEYFRHDGERSVLEVENKLHLDRINKGLKSESDPRDVITYDEFWNHKKGKQKLY